MIKQLKYQVSTYRYLYLYIFIFKYIHSIINSLAVMAALISTLILDACLGDIGGGFCLLMWRHPNFII
jgi:hypothetical protein